MFRRWRKADTWEDVKKVMRRQRCWCINICYVVFYLCVFHYEKCVQVVDYRRLTPALLQEWSETIEARSGCAKDFLFFTDG